VLRKFRGEGEGNDQRGSGDVANRQVKLLSAREKNAVPTSVGWSKKKQHNDLSKQEGRKRDI